MVNDSNEKMVEILTEILKWIKFSGAKEVRGTLISTLDSDQKILIYDLSDGFRGSVEIAKIAKSSDTTIRRYWASWARRGIVESIKVRGGDRYKKSFELEDFDIAIPKLYLGSQVAIKSKEEPKQ
jgi:Fic family protein